MARTPAESRALFDRWSATYNASVLMPEGPLAGYAGSLAAAAGLLPVDQGELVLDVGIGTGAFAALLAERGARIWGVDMSPGMLERCHQSHPAFTLAEGDFLNIPFGHAFNAVVASFAFHEVAPADRPRALRSIAGKLKPGGRICLLDIIFASSAATAEAAVQEGEYWDESEDYPLVGDLDRSLREAGFTSICWMQAAPYHWAVVAQLREGAGGQAIMTERLRLVPAGADLLKVAVAGEPGARAKLPVRLPDNWPEVDLREFLPVLIEQLEGDPSGSQWAVWLMIDQVTNQVVGDLGFKGPPDAEGQVEIGYGVLPQHRRKGYAFEAVQALVNWAFQERGLRAVLAECLHDNLGSIRVLEKLGMERLAPEGEMLKWRLSR